MKKTLLLLSLFILTLSLQGIDKFDRKADSSRKKEGKVIICSPKGGNGTLTLDEALEELQPGNVLRLCPGRYAFKDRHDVRTIQLKQSNIIIEGDGSGHQVQLSLDFRGSGCIIRNIHLAGHMEAEGITIVDARINPMICNSDKFSESLIYNCSISGATVYPNNAQITFKKCTFYHNFSAPKKYSYFAQATWRVGGGGGGGERSGISGGYGAIINLGQMAGKGGIEFNQCIFYTTGYALRNNYTIKSLRLTFKKNLFMCGQGIIFQGIWGTENVPEKATAKGAKITKVSHSESDFKTVRDRCSVSQEKNYFLKPSAEKGHPTPVALSHYEIPAAKSTTAVLEIGANLGASAVPSPRQEKGEVAER